MRVTSASNTIFTIQWAKYVQRPNGNFTHFDNVLSFETGKFSMKFEHKDIVFIGEEK